MIYGNGLTQRYEEVRPGGRMERSNLGQALLKSRGLVAWMMAWADYRPTPGGPGCSWIEENRRELPIHLPGQVVGILAQMVLEIAQGG